jgi:hypothetical protein
MKWALLLVVEIVACAALAHAAFGHMVVWP